MVRLTVAFAVCFAPRFAISCTRELLAEVAKLARERGVMIHTHASENMAECEMVENETGLRNIVYLDSLGVSGRHVVAGALRPRQSIENSKRCTEPKRMWRIVRRRI